MVKDVIMPIIGKVGGQPDFSGITISATKVMRDGREVVEGGIMIGSFMNATVALIISCTVIFSIVVKPVMKFTAPKSAPAEPVAATTPNSRACDLSAGA